MEVALMEVGLNGGGVCQFSRARVSDLFCGVQESSEHEERSKTQAATDIKFGANWELKFGSGNSCNGAVVGERSESTSVKVTW